MPCYQSNVISVELKTENKEMLEGALKALGHEYVYNRDGSVTVKTKDGFIDIRDGQAQFSFAKGQDAVNAIKREYSNETVKSVAKKYKFNIRVHEDGQLELWKYTSGS